MSEPKTYEEVIDEITLFDQWGFQIKPEYPWQPESLEAKKERLQYNVDCYRECLKNGAKFPKEVNQDRKADYLWLRTKNEMV